MYMNKTSKQDTISIYPKIVCPNCNVNYSNSNVISDPESGEYICNNCGLVISSEKALEMRPEWRIFNLEQSNNNSRIRTGMPTSLARHDMGLSTIIGRADRD